MRRPALRLCLCLCLCLSAAGLAADEAPLSPTAAAAPGPGPHLEGRWGVGYDNIPGASASSNIVQGLSTANAAAVRYWISDTLAWDGLLALDLNSQPAGTGSATNTQQRGYGLGTVLKYNLRRPTPWLMGQVLARASLAQLQESSVTGFSGSQTTVTLGVGLGVGFEAFFPLWDSLSVEGNVNAAFSSAQTKVDGVDGAAQDSSSLSINGNGFTPVNVSIHLYF